MGGSLRLKRNLKMESFVFISLLKLRMIRNPLMGRVGAMRFYLKAGESLRPTIEMAVLNISSACLWGDLPYEFCDRHGFWYAGQVYGSQVPDIEGGFE